MMGGKQENKVGGSVMMIDFIVEIDCSTVVVQKMFR